MRELIFKDNCRFKKWNPIYEKILRVLWEMQRFYLFIPDDLVVTSVDDSTHTEGSAHYRGEAIDVRSKNFKSIEDKTYFIALLKSRLGPKFTVLFENEGKDNEHFHIQLRIGATFP